MQAVYAGDLPGIWLGLSRAVVILTSAALLLSPPLHLLLGHGLAFGPGEVAALAGLTAGLGSEAFKLVRGLQVRAVPDCQEDCLESSAHPP